MPSIFCLLCHFCVSMSVYSYFILFHMKYKPILQKNVCTWDKTVLCPKNAYRWSINLYWKFDHTSHLIEKYLKISAALVLQGFNNALALKGLTWDPLPAAPEASSICLLKREKVLCFTENCFTQRKSWIPTHPVPRAGGDPNCINPQSRDAAEYQDCLRREKCANWTAESHLPDQPTSKTLV